MNKILVLAYYFPPLGMGGTQRAAKFVKYLPQFDWMPYVVTVKDVAYYAKDATLLQEIESTKIYRTGSFDPQRLLQKICSNKSKTARKNKSFTQKKWQLLNKIVAWILVPDSKLLWLPFAILKTCKVIKNENIQFLFTTSPPHSIHLAGLIIQKLMGVLWIADFRDGWSAGNFQYEPTIIHKWLNRYLERLVLSRADKIIGVSQRLTDSFKQKVPNKKSDIFVLTNGFDSQDMADTNNTGRNEKFTITFCGSMTSMAPLSGFFEGLSQALKKHVELKSEIVVKLIGMDWDEKVETMVYKYGLEQVVRLPGYVFHLEAFKEIMHADLLLYPIAESASRDFIPGKTFEYLASGNPTLILGPEVEGVEILKQASEVVITNHDDFAVIEKTILKYFAMFQQQTINNSNKINILKYDRKYLTGRLATILNA